MCFWCVAVSVARTWGCSGEGRRKRTPRKKTWIHDAHGWQPAGPPPSGRSVRPPAVAPACGPLTFGHPPAPTAFRRRGCRHGHPLAVGRRFRCMHRRMRTTTPADGTRDRAPCRVTSSRQGPQAGNQDTMHPGKNRGKPPEAGRHTAGNGQPGAVNSSTHALPSHAPAVCDTGRRHRQRAGLDRPGKHRQGTDGALQAPPGRTLSGEGTGRRTPVPGRKAQGGRKGEREAGESAARY